MLRRYFSVPNSSMGFMGMVKAKQLEACGAIAGVWDMPVFDDLGACHWIEFKVGADTVSKPQKKFMSSMLPLGNQFFYVVHENVEVFICIFTAIVTKDDRTLKELMYDDRKKA